MTKLELTIFIGLLLIVGGSIGYMLGNSVAPQASVTRACYEDEYKHQNGICYAYDGHDMPTDKLQQSVNNNNIKLQYGNNTNKLPYVILGEF